MKSATSYCNGALIKKNLTRFWPLWGLYALLWLYLLPVECLLSQHRYYYDDPSANTRFLNFVQNIPDLVRPGLYLAVIFGILAAMAMFSYLYNNRSACMMHALPVRREELFLSAYLSGVIGFMGPHMAVWLLTLAAEAAGGHADFFTITVWLLAQSGMCLFFYSFAVFCAMFTGHILALPVFYGILNMLAFVIVYLIDSLISGFLYGYSGVSSRVLDAVVWLVPVLRLEDYLYWTTTPEGRYYLAGAGSIAVYAAAGVVLAVIALLVYRRRQVENAGDVVSVPVMRPVFKYGVALCSALTLGYVFSALFLGLDGTFPLAASMLLWGVIGYFAAEMLLRKSFRVLGAWRGCAAMSGALLVFILALHFDLFGYTRHIPSQENIQSVSVSGMYTAPRDEGSRVGLEDLTDPESIALVASIHRAIVEQRNGAGGYYDTDTSFRVTYRMKDGSTLSRTYHGVLLREGEAPAPEMEALVNLPVSISQAYSLDQLEEARLINVYLSDLWDGEGKSSQDLSLHNLGEPDPAVLENIRQAVLQDFREGNLGRRYLFGNSQQRLENTYVTDLHLVWVDTLEQIMDPGYTLPEPEAVPTLPGDYDDYEKYEYYYGYTPYGHSMAVTLTPQASHTIAALREAGLLSQGLELQPFQN